MNTPTCAATTCDRTARTLVITGQGASALCDRHDAIARGLSLTHRPDEGPAHIVANVGEVTA